MLALVGIALVTSLRDRQQAEDYLLLAFQLPAPIKEKIPAPRRRSLRGVAHEFIKVSDWEKGDRAVEK